MKSRFAMALITLLALAAVAPAQTLQGTVTNGTSNRPAAGAQITLLSLAQGMSETAHAKTDASGHFQFTYSDANMPHLVRVTHQDVDYFKMAPPGTNSVAVQVYDAARKLEEIATSIEVVRFQSDGSALQVIHIYAVQNTSQPARTLIGSHSYQIAVPEGAVIDQAAARAPGGQPVNSMPDAIPGQKNQYAFNFPLRPGETQFEIAYHLPYRGQATVLATLLHDVQHFVAVLPSSMQFSATGATFSTMAEEKDANVQITSNAHAGDQIAMTVSGTGVLADDSGQGDQAAPGGGMSSRPGGGLGAPIDAPDPLSRYRWPLLGGLAALMTAGAFFVLTRRTPAPETGAAGSGNFAPEDTLPKSMNTVATPPRSSALLDAVKEELFQLEIDRQQGRLSEQDYQKAKAALDVTLRRAMARVRKE